MSTENNLTLLEELRNKVLEACTRHVEEQLELVKDIASKGKTLFVYQTELNPTILRKCWEHRGLNCEIKPSMNCRYENIVNITWE
jgi:hypothetical protein